jgi:antirestriction protein ArdC
MGATVYDVITDRIVSMLEQGTAPWRKPWRQATGEPRNLISGKPYRGINIFLLSATGFSSPCYAGSVIMRALCRRLFRSGPLGSVHSA